MKKINKRSNVKSLILGNESLFDKDIASIIVDHPDDYNLNPLFLNTRQFNNTTIEYKTFKAEIDAKDSEVPQKTYGKSGFKTNGRIKSRTN